MQELESVIVSKHALQRSKERLKLKSEQKKIRNSKLAFLRGEQIEQDKASGKIVKFYNCHYYIFQRGINQTEVYLITVLPYCKNKFAS